MTLWYLWYPLFLLLLLEEKQLLIVCSYQAVRCAPAGSVQAPFLDVQLWANFLLLIVPC